jgi:hypothetical protein
MGGDVRLLPVATTTEVLRELELRGVPKSEMPDLRALSDLLHRHGARPLNPTPDNPKRANPIMGSRLWRIARYWTDLAGVRWDLESCPASRLAKLYHDRTMPPATKGDFKVVDEESEI